MDDRIVGIVGGGQLGRMMTQACHRLGVRTACLDPSGTSSPCGQICDLSVEGSLQDSIKYAELASVSDLLTIEVEHVNCDALRDLNSTGMIVHPNEGTIRMIQDKYIQKKFFEDHQIPLPDFIEVPNIENAKKVGKQFGYPFMLKSRKFAYDGKGNAIVNNEEELEEAFSLLLRNNSKVISGGRKVTSSKENNSKQTIVNDEYDDDYSNHSTSIYAEKWVPFEKELAVMVVRSKHDIITYPVVETTQKNSICHSVLAPAQISEITQNLVSSLITKCFSHITGIGIYGVELFLLHDGSILFNEIAPRPHNSGH
jgi:phosphoribosylaminoimidazole carboxylase